MFLFTGSQFDFITSSTPANLLVTNPVYMHFEALGGNSFEMLEGGGKQSMLSSLFLDRTKLSARRFLT